MASAYCPLSSKPSPLPGLVLDEDGERLQPRAGSADTDDTKQLLGVGGGTRLMRRSANRSIVESNRQKFIICHWTIVKPKIISQTALFFSKFFAIVASVWFVKVSDCHGDQEFALFSIQ